VLPLDQLPKPETGPQLVLGAGGGTQQPPVELPWLDLPPEAFGSEVTGPPGSRPSGEPFGAPFDLAGPAGLLTSPAGPVGVKPGAGPTLKPPVDRGGPVGQPPGPALRALPVPEPATALLLCAGLALLAGRRRG
jgi:hypothetical protein